MTRFGLALVMMGALVGCASDDDETTCEVVNQRICDMACACADGDECVISSGGASIIHDNAGDCSGFWVTFGCVQPEADQVNYAACDVALDSAQCVDTTMGMGLAFPAECGDDPMQ